LNRIDARFAKLRQSRRAGLIPYITAGHPNPDWTVSIMHALVESGADLIELGVPFSDVMADGPVIQHACARALEQGMTWQQVLAMVAEFRRRDPHTPVVLMGYMNPMERRGMEAAVGESARAGVDGLLIVDCPVEESAEPLALLAGNDMHQICLAAPTTRPARLERLASVAGGFIYMVSLKGVTGSAALDIDSLAGPIGRIRELTDCPIAVGFGIREAAQAAAVAGIADGVVIGSALVSVLDECKNLPDAVAAVRQFVEPIRKAMDNNRELPSTPGRPAVGET